MSLDETNKLQKIIKKIMPYSILKKVYDRYNTV